MINVFKYLAELKERKVIFIFQVPHVAEKLYLFLKSMRGQNFSKKRAHKYKINGTYEAFEIPIENFEDSIKNLVEQQKLCGFNITIPHKEKIYNL